MIFLDNNYNRDNSLEHLSLYLTNKNINLNQLTNIVIHIDDYNKMIINRTVDTFFNRALDQKINAIILYDFHGWTSFPTNLEQAPIKTIALTYDFNLYKCPKFNCFYYPNWLFFIRNKLTGNKIVPLYPISCAGRNFNDGRAGKIYNYQRLKEHSWFNRILFSKWQSSLSEFEYFSLPSSKEDPEFFSVLENFLLDYNTWPKWSGDELSLNNSMKEMNIDIYNKSLFHLVAESRVVEPLLSEKTFKTLCTKQIPIFCAAMGAVAHLRALGFDMFDDIIEHNKYDLIADWKQRILTMHDVIGTIIDLDHSALLELTEQQRQYNFNHVTSITIDKEIFDPIIAALS
jgi:hypothetical protein